LPRTPIYAWTKDARRSIAALVAGVFVATGLVVGCSTADEETRRGGDVPAPDASKDATPTPTPTPSDLSRRPECLHWKVTIVGTEGDDRLVGTAETDVIAGLGGNDVIVTTSPRDRVCGGEGDDRIEVAGSRTWISAGSGNDRVVAQGRFTSVRAENGDDTVTVRGQSTSVRPGPGDDLVRNVGGRVAPRNAWYNEPCVGYGRSDRPVFVDLGKGRARGEGKDRLLGFTCVQASRYADVLIGTSFNDSIDATMGGADDRIRTLGGDDLVAASGGDDQIDVGPGDDVLDAFGGNDRSFGGPGNDTLRGFWGGDYLNGGAGNDRVYGGVECDPASSYGYGTVDKDPNELLGGPGDDYITGDLGNDSLDGGPGADRGQGGYQDGREDLIYSLERFTEC